MGLGHFWQDISGLIAIASMVLGLAQAVYVWLYARGAARELDFPLATEFPKAAVVVCLRGRDPTLDAALRAIALQTYPRFEIHLVLDSSADPAAAVAREFRSQNPERCQIHVLPKPSMNCGLKCDLQRLAFSRISSDVDVLVFTDADCEAPADWLNQLIRPLSDPVCGAVSGNRWYGHAPGWGSEIRRIWNAAAIVQMYLYRIPWGGAMAIRRTAIEQAGLIDLWRMSLCEDTLVKSALKPFGWRVDYLPTLALVSHEKAGFWSAANWIRRQLLTARLYHPAWPLVAGHSLLVGATTLALVLGSLTMALTANWMSMGLCLAGFFLSQAINLGLLAWIEATTVPQAERQREWRETMRHLGRQYGLVTLTQLIHSWSAFRAIFASHVTWRGIQYRVSRQKVEMLEYHPFQQATDSFHSIF